MDESVPIRVMVVDDQRMFADSIARLLDREDDLEVVGVAASVSEACAIVAELVPDVAVVDFQLPDGDGAGLTREILARSPATHVLVLTASNEERILIASIQSGCTGFLTKDKATEELVAAVRLASLGESYIPSDLLAALLPKLGNRRRGIGGELTKRELEILGLLRSGASTASIADSQYVSIHTVRNHVRNIMMKLHAHSRLEAVAIATREGLFVD